MKKRILNTIVLLSVLFSLSGCGLLSKIFHKPTGTDEPTEVVTGNPVMTQVTHIYNLVQVDSMCVADTIPHRFEGWIHQTFQDYETGTVIYRYSYAKESSKNYHIMYIVTQRGDMYVVNKRKTEFK